MRSRLMRNPIPFRAHLRLPLLQPPSPTIIQCKRSTNWGQGRWSHGEAGAASVSDGRLKAVWWATPQLLCSRVERSRNGTMPRADRADALRDGPL